jgi:hypothetical protein
MLKNILMIVKVNLWHFLIRLLTIRAQENKTTKKSYLEDTHLKERQLYFRTKFISVINL